MSDRLKVCHVVEATNGGVRRHVVDLLSNLPTDELEIWVAHSLVRSDATWRDALIELSPRLRAIEIEMHRAINPWRDARAILELRRLFRRERFDVIHVHSGKGGLLGRTAAALAGTRARVVYTPNASPFRLSRVYGLVEKALTAVTDMIVAVTPSEFEELSDAGVAGPQSLRMVMSGIDVAAFAEDPTESAAVRSSMGIAKSRLVIGSVGRMSAQKSPLLFLHACTEVLRDHPQAMIMWVGDGELRAEFEAAAGQLGIADRLILPGWLDDVRPAFAAMDVFCLLSSYESLGYVTLEAMAMGVPAVGTAVAGTRDVIADGVTGFLVEPANSDAAAAAIHRLLQDPELRRRMGDAGRRRVEEHFSAAAMARQTTELYRELTLRETGAATGALGR